MKTITIYRRDFKNHADDGESLFDIVLEQLSIPKDKWENIEEVDLTVSDFDVSD